MYACIHAICDPPAVQCSYHSQSMRFGTFSHSTEAERATLSREYSLSSLWTFLDHCHQRSPHFQNFLYLEGAPIAQTLLRPHAFLPRLAIWSFFTEGAVRGCKRGMGGGGGGEGRAT